MFLLHDVAIVVHKHVVKNLNKKNFNKKILINFNKRFNNYFLQ